MRRYAASSITIGVRRNARLSFSRTASSSEETVTS
jgi:hypothetical protein